MNPELKLVDALTELLRGVELVLPDGTSDGLQTVHYAKFPKTKSNNTWATIVPLGPQFRVAQLGLGSSNDARKKHVAVDVVISHEHHDEEIGLKNLSALTWAAAEAINASAHLAGAEHCGVESSDYDWHFDDRDGDGQADALFLGVAVLRVEARFPRR